MKLFTFRYLSRQDVASLISQIEGGVSQQSKQTDRADKGGGLNASAKIPGTSVGIGADGKKASSSETERVLADTPEAHFSRIYEELTSSKQLKFFESIDEKSWESIKRGAFVEVDGEVRIDPLSNLGDMAAVLPGIGKLTNEPVSGTDLAEFDQISTFSKLVPDVPVTVSIGNDPTYRFIAQLDQESFYGSSVNDVAGQARVLMNVGRKLKEDEVHTSIQNIPALRNLPDEAIEEMKKSLNDDPSPMPGLVIKPPAAFAQIIAIYP